MKTKQGNRPCGDQRSWQEPHRRWGQGAPPGRPPEEGLGQKCLWEENQGVGCHDPALGPSSSSWERERVQMAAGAPDRTSQFLVLVEVRGDWRVSLAQAPPWLMRTCVPPFPATVGQCPD